MPVVLVVAIQLRGCHDLEYRKMRVFVLGLALLAVTPVAVAGHCDDKARPKQFNKDTAMEAVFCEYNRAHGGTLIPLENTAQWDISSSDTLATPLITATYQEGNSSKGVLAVQRQMLEPTGEPVSSHGQGAIISIYVFKHDGTSWVFEKGKKNATEAGTWGNAPSGKLAKIGPEKHGLVFESSWVGQGYIVSSAFIMALSEKEISVVGDFDTGQSNSGACEDDPMERNEMVGACWDYEGKVEFIEKRETPYYMLRIAYSGTKQKEENDRDEVTPKSIPECYIFTGSKYVTAKDRDCVKGKAVESREIFGVTP